MCDLALALVWHQHQPYYPDDIGQENPMPWVRLHAAKDYWGMAMQLKEVPELQATINLVPSLLVQLSQYLDEGREDTHLRLSRSPADGLSEEDLYYLLDNFFMVHPDHMIRPHARYWELYQRRGMTVDPASRAAKRFRRQDILDLQCWSNLVWMHPIALEQDTDLAEFKRKGARWTESDKAWLLDKQMQLMREVIPLHRELMQSGQLELTTTPFYHPILPLLLDKRLAREAMPDVALPRSLDSYLEDAQSHVRQAVEYHTKVFGARPRGMWPAEGSVAQGVIPAFAQNGITWIATDEEILSCSTHGSVARDANGFLKHPEMLYRPWRVEEKGQSVNIVFRDHAMSDQIGFHYQRYMPDAAVSDFIGKLEAISLATAGKTGHRPPLVSIILDGENCWEYYHQSGRDFLRTLYQRVAQHPRIDSVKVSDYLEKYPATDKIGKLFAGSWIQHNFGIWIGHPECNRAWDLLAATRQRLVKAANERGHSSEKLAAAWREMHIAEGSDWFWWFGDSHSSSQDDTFDRLFRKHLENVYRLLDDVPSAELMRPIGQSHQPRQYTEPNGLLNVRLDGRQTYFEWINAGRHRVGRGSGAMTMASDGRVTDLYFGFDGENLLARLDFRGLVRDQLGDVESMRMVFLEPAGHELLLVHPEWEEPICQMYHDDIPVIDHGVTAAGDSILEMRIPLDVLGATSDNAIRFFVELMQKEQPVERVPAEGAIETSVPSEDFEATMWQV